MSVVIMRDGEVVGRIDGIEGMDFNSRIEQLCLIMKIAEIVKFELFPDYDEYFRKCGWLN